MTSYTPALLLMLLMLAGAWAWVRFLYMPRGGYNGPLPPATAREQELARDLEGSVAALAAIGERNVQRRYRELHATAGYLEDRLRRMGYKPRRLDFLADRRTVCNLEVECRGSEPGLPLLLVGAHYDTVDFSPGANDNGSGVAGVLALAEAFARAKPRHGIRFLFFVNEEAPWFMTPAMGARRYAEDLRAAGTPILGIVNMETIGYYSEAPDSQRYPRILRPFFPRQGDFIAFVANSASRPFLHRLLRSFRNTTMFPSEGAAVPERLRDICRSDHYPFWQQGYPGVMITDTANFRYPHYHTPEDTPDKVDFDRMARVVAGLEKAIAEMVG